MTDERALSKQLASDYKTLLELPSGRRILRHILFELVDLRGPVFSNNSLVMAHAEGRRSLGRSVSYEIDASVPGAYASLMSEIAKEASNGR